LSPAEGRKFGFTVGAAFLVLAGLLYFWRDLETAGAITGALGGLLIMAALLLPAHLGPVLRAWMGLAHAISKVTTPIFMGIVFFLVMTPIGLLMRLFGKRALVHREQNGSFWAAPGSGGRSDLKRQF
jgi:Na+(H+)/acetate symporter ActP